MNQNSDQALDLPDLPQGAASIGNGHYTLKCHKESILHSKDSNIQAQVWFRSAPLTQELISRIHGLKLLAETHDQGYASDPDAGNWTWLELSILEDEFAKSVRTKDGIDLVWMSHYNRFLTNNYGWEAGAVFDKQHDILRLLEEGNVIAVRICARFSGWEIYARMGCLVFDIGSSLDGGGVRGLASLHLLKAVLDKACPGELPCNVFDMIGGTSTGGLIAIMLGRLRMTIDECIEKYELLMKEVFKLPWWAFGKKSATFLKNRVFYDTNVLEKVIKRLVKEKLGREDAELTDDSGSCKVFVMAVHKEAPNNREPVFLRSYQNPSQMPLLPKVKIWQAARATSAAPTYFDPIEINGYMLVDGSLGANNPLGWLWTEVLAVFGPARATSCFLSIGTGISSNRPLKDVGLFGDHDVEAAFASVATNAEIIHILFQTLIRAFAPENLKSKYWRLNVGRKVPAWTDKSKGNLDNYEGAGELDDIPALKGLMLLVNEYINEQVGMIEECARALKTST